MTIYFVCHGNTCRSPLALEIFRGVASDRGIHGIDADSCGIYPYPDKADIAEMRGDALREVLGEGTEIQRHESKGLSDVELCKGDRLLLLDSRLKDALVQKLGSMREEVLFKVADIHDPYRGGLEDYVLCCHRLKAAIEENLNWLIDGKGKSQDYSNTVKPRFCQSRSFSRRL